MGLDDSAIIFEIQNKIQVAKQSNNQIKQLYISRHPQTKHNIRQQQIRSFVITKPNPKFEESINKPSFSTDSQISSSASGLYPETFKDKFIPNYYKNWEKQNDQIEYCIRNKIPLSAKLLMQKNLREKGRKYQKQQQNQQQIYSQDIEAKMDSYNYDLYIFDQQISQTYNYTFVSEINDVHEDHEYQELDILNKSQISQISDNLQIITCDLLKDDSLNTNIDISQIDQDPSYTEIEIINEIVQLQPKIQQQQIKQVVKYSEVIGIKIAHYGGECDDEISGYFDIKKDTDTSLFSCCK
ncbi:hypothetical protein SS50377_27713 [Spironucleus salmonicida]|uniref:Uncharacterized protein n=1 Tax=Spironucleus salmonicida TaxID=348837 RepID=V6LS42_9EUKA|nr:hypothetical protein SS50377_27713 [Spironucleus salmonicida]|eukprot:EST46511.1 Hypothetical protein SS50377_13317 [Spironucleus salmonicida]